MTGHQHGGHGGGIETAKAIDDHLPGAAFVVLGHLALAQGPRDGHGTVKMVGVRRAQAGDLPPGLGEHRGVTAVRVHDAADRLESAVQDHVGGRVAGGFQLALHHAAVQVHHDHALGLKLVVGYAAGLDDHQARGAIDAAGVAPGERHQAGLGQVAVDCTNESFQIVQHQWLFRRNKD